MEQGTPKTALADEKTPATPPKKGFWRTNVEGFTVAIAVALVIKAYAFEAFQVPTESMEPTIIGRTPGGDRIIVNKFRYVFSDPERYDIMVFRYPLARPVNYVKRLAGVSGEYLLIVDGDLYTSQDDVTYSIARKPPNLAGTTFSENPVIPLEDAETIKSSWVREWFDLPDGTLVGDGEVRVPSGSGERMVRTRIGRLTPERRDPYAPTRGGKGDAAVAEPVPDLRWDVTLNPGDGAKTVILELLDGTMPDQPLRLELSLQGDTPSRVLLGNTEIADQKDHDVSLSSQRLKLGEDAEVRFENLDDRIRVEIDGEEVFFHEYAQAWQRDRRVPSRASVGVADGSLKIRSLKLFRDIYYTLYEPDRAKFRVPEGHYLFFGDNSPNSLDARGWRVVGIRRREDGLVLLGDMEAVSDSFEWPRRDSNPFFHMEPDVLPGGRKVAKKLLDENVHRFLDIHGNTWKLPSASYDILDLNGFGVPSGSPDILKLHGTHVTEPTAAQMGIEGVDTARLKNELRPYEGVQHPFRAFSVLMHYVNRQDVQGQANLIFWPPSRWGVIR